MRHTDRLAASFAALLLASLPAFAAEETSTSAAQPSEATPSATAPSAATPAAKEPELTQEEKAEKGARKECKKKICDIIATRDPEGEDISCDIVKTWRGEDIAKMLGGKIDWPWGNAVCQSKLELARKPLASAMSEARYEIVMPAQKVRCTLAQKTEGEPYAIEVTMAPKVKFENGKAIEATINWGEATAPMFVYPLIYAGTGLDNSANVLGPEVVRMVNEFVTKKCAEVKAELPSSKPN